MSFIRSIASRCLLKVNRIPVRYRAKSTESNDDVWIRTSGQDLSYTDSRAYQGHGKTTVNVLNKDVEDLLMIDSFSTHGFRLNSGLFIIGPCAVLPRTIFYWDVPNHRGITPESLALFWLMEPKVDVLLIGAGDKGNTIPQETRSFLQKVKINHEVLSTPDAIGQFNFLNAENRNVACCLIPPETVAIETMEDLIDTQRLKKRWLTGQGSSAEEVWRLKEARMEKALQEISDRKWKGEPIEPPENIIRRDEEKMNRLLHPELYPEEKPKKEDKDKNDTK